jgi:hypothetical protein
VRCLPAALDLLHGRPRHQLGSRRRLRRRQLPGGGRLTSASIPHPPRVPETFLPDEGESEPVPASGTNPACHPGQLSPRSPGASHSSVERCRGRPARTTRAGRARLHYVEREDPGDGHPQPPAERPSSRRGTSACRSQARRPRTCASQATPAPAVAKTHSSQASSQNHQKTLPSRLTDSLLRW